MRILISSNGIHTNTGYGTQSKGLVKTLLALDHDVAVFSWYGLSGGIIQADKVTLYPRLRHAYGGDAAIPAQHFKADLVITLEDIWVLPGDFATSLPAPWAAWFPIDGDPLAPPIEAIARTASYPITFSKYGAAQLDMAGLDYTYIPHGIDTAVFKPMDKAALREKHNVPPNTFLVAMVAANKGYPARKAFPEALQAFKAFSEMVPEAVLYLHTLAQAPGEGLDLEDVIRLAGVDRSRVIFVNQADYTLGLPDSYVAEIYNIADVLLSPSYGEGFGLPVIEAQACNTPVITNDCTSMRELTLNGVAVQPLQRFYNPLGTWHYVPDIEGIVEALHHIYLNQDLYNSDIVVERISNTYSWDSVRPLWADFLRMVEDDRRIAEGRVSRSTRKPILRHTRDDLLPVTAVGATNE